MEVTEELGRVIDTADNFLTYGDNDFMPVTIKVDALLHGLQEIRRELLEVYLLLGGEDVWK